MSYLKWILYALLWYKTFPTRLIFCSKNKRFFPFAFFFYSNKLSEKSIMNYAFVTGTKSLLSFKNFSFFIFHQKFAYTLFFHTQTQTLHIKRATAWYVESESKKYLIKIEWKLSMCWEIILWMSWREIMLWRESLFNYHLAYKIWFPIHFPWLFANFFHAQIFF